MKKILSLLIAVLMIASLFVSVAGAEEKKDFPDVTEGKWFYEAVMYAFEKGVVLGFDDGTFGPGKGMTRAQFVTILWRIAGEPASTFELTFKDTKNDAWYSPQVKWAVESGLVSGYNDNTFRPGVVIQRQQIAKLIKEFFTYMKIEAPDNEIIKEYKDAADIQSWAVEYMEFVRVKGIMNGDSNGNVTPRADTTRAQVCSILQTVLPIAEGAGDKMNDALASLEESGVGILYVDPNGFNAEKIAEVVKGELGLTGRKDNYAVEFPDLDLDALNNGIAGITLSTGYLDTEIGVRVRNLDTDRTTKTAQIKFTLGANEEWEGDIVEAREDGVSEEEYIMNLGIDHLFNKYSCGAHQAFHFRFSYGRTFTKEALEALMLQGTGLDPEKYALVIDYEAEEGDETFPEIKEGYGGADTRSGGGGSLYFAIMYKEDPDNIFEDFLEEISVNKNLGALYPHFNGCPDDIVDSKAAADGEKVYNLFKDTFEITEKYYEIHVSAEDFDSEKLSNYLLENFLMTKLLEADVGYDYLQTQFYILDPEYQSHGFSISEGHVDEFNENGEYTFTAEILFGPASIHQHFGPEGPLGFKAMKKHGFTVEGLQFRFVKTEGPMEIIVKE